jgi:hypothetical protein
VPAPRNGGKPGEPGDGKVPAIAWREFQQRRPTDAEIVNWFDVQHAINIAVVTGESSDAVVIDADAPEALRWCTRHLPYTPWQTKTARGFHLWYRHPGVRVPNRAHIETNEGDLAIDVRGDGGFVIAPGSRHASGAFYVEAGDWNAPRSEVPRFWPGWLQRSTPKPTTRAIDRTMRRSGDLIERARRYLAAIPLPEIGQGSDVATLSAACRLRRGFDLSASDAEDLLWEWAGGRPGWTREWIAEKVENAERYGSETIGALR